MPPDPDIAALIRNAGSSNAFTLHDACWPQGGDRTDVVAREWVRLWGPARAAKLDWDPGAPN